MQQLRLGKWNTLEVVRQVDFGYYLDCGDLGDVLLPIKEAPEAGVNIGDKIDVFLYLDSEERLIATTLRPKVEVNEFAFLEVKWVNQYGAFLDWGLMKDLFCPFREQKMRMQVGKKYIIYCYIDSVTYRIVASAKVEKFLSKEMPDYTYGQQVEALVQHKTELGFKCIVDGKYSGQLFNNEIFGHIETGQRLKAYVKYVRTDAKIDLVMQQGGMEHVRDFANTLLSYIQQCPEQKTIFCDKSLAEDIYNQFGVSKKTFKRAVGDLYKQGLITISDNGLTLTEKGRFAGCED
ncbi:MAG: GntR family transcriptional regulator [Bacteroidaceae bacterium]|nr:GntR family transcriptional regulator [Bacteroidaceae bacterium]